MKILVTGGTGFIGRRLVPALLASNHSVTVVDSSGRLLRDFDPRAPILSKRSQDFFSELMTINSLSVVREMFESTDLKFDAIIDLGAKSNVQRSIKSPEETIMNNTGSTLAALAYCCAAGNVRYIFASSSRVGSVDYNSNPYVLSKKMSEDMVSMYRGLYSLDATSVRIFNVYGPGDEFHANSSCLIHACKQSHKYRNQFHMYGDGSMRKSYIHIFDVIDGLISILNDETLKPCYELSHSNDEHTVKEIIETFAEGADLPIRQVDSESFDVNYVQPDKSLHPDYWYPKMNLIDYINEWKTSGRLFE